MVRSGNTPRKRFRQRPPPIAVCFPERHGTDQTLQTGIEEEEEEEQVGDLRRYIYIVITY